MLRKHKLNDAPHVGVKGFCYDTSKERQNVALKIICEDVRVICALCNEFNRDVPTQMKLIYDVKKNSLQTVFKYGLVYSDDPEKTADDVENEWFEEMRS